MKIKFRKYAYTLRYIDVLPSWVCNPCTQPRAYAVAGGTTRPEAGGSRAEVVSVRQTTTRKAKEKREMNQSEIRCEKNINTVAVILATALHLNVFGLLFILLKIESMAWVIGVPAGLLDLYLLGWGWWQLWRQQTNPKSDVLGLLLRSLISERTSRA